MSETSYKKKRRENEIKALKEDTQIRRDWFYLIKWIACLTMVIDHISKLRCMRGVFTVSEAFSMQMIGRTAFPLFAWELVQHFIHSDETKKRKTLLRLIILAVVSQVFYVILGWGENSFNVIAELALGWSLLILYGECGDSKILKFLLFVVTGAISLINFDYHIAGLLLITLFYYVSKNCKKKILGDFLSLFAFMVSVSLLSFGLLYTTFEWKNVGYGLIINLAVFLCLIPISLARKNVYLPKLVKTVFDNPFGRWLGRYFYPLHLVALFIFDTAVFLFR